MNFIASWLVDYYGVRPRLWTAAINGHNVHPPHDTSLESDGETISLSLSLFSIVKIGLQQFSWTTDSWDIR
jgi:hypothetical protein